VVKHQRRSSLRRLPRVDANVANILFHEGKYDIIGGNSSQNIIFGSVFMLERRAIERLENSGSWHNGCSFQPISLRTQRFQVGEECRWKKNLQAPRNRRCCLLSARAAASLSNHGNGCGSTKSTVRTRILTINPKRAESGGSPHRLSNFAAQ
jgi:hypothetical protein